MSKGKVTQHFLLKGLEKIANFIQIKDLIDQNIITQQQIEELYKQMGLQLILSEVLSIYIQTKATMP